MKLNYNCVRELLLFAEENLTYSTYIEANKLQLPGYSSEETVYAAEKLIEAGYLQGNVNKYINNNMPTVLISSISFEGHQFLDNIRDAGVWKETKKALSKVSSASLNVVNSIATQVLTALITNQLNI